MEFRRVLAFILTTAMLLGNTVPAYATGVDGNGVTVVDEGDIKTTDVGEDGEEEEEGDVAEQNENDGGSDESGAGNDIGGGSDNGNSNDESSLGNPSDGGSDGGDEGHSSAQEGNNGENGGNDEGATNGEGSDTGEESGDSLQGDANGDSNPDEEGDNNGENPDDKSDGGDSAQNDEAGDSEGGNQEGTDDGENPDDGDGEEGENSDQEEGSDHEELGDEEINDEEEEEDSLSDNTISEMEKEEALDEDSVSENDISVSMNELPTKNTESGGFVSLEGFQKTYATIGDAIADIINVTQDKTVTVSLPTEMEEGYGTEFVIFGNDLEAPEGYDVTLVLNGNTLKLKENNGNSVVKSNVSIIGGIGKGEIELASSQLTFWILEKTSEELHQGMASTNLENIDFIGDGSGVLKIGGNTTDETEELRAAYVTFRDITFNAYKEIQIYDRCSFECPIEVDKLYIDLVASKEPSGSETIDLSDTVVKELELNGTASWRNGFATTVSVSEKTTLWTKATYAPIDLLGNCTFNNLMVLGNDSLKLQIFAYDDGNKEYKTNLQFGGSITSNGKPIIVSCMDEIQKREFFTAGDTIATIANESETQPITADLFQAENVVVVREGNKLIAKDQYFKVMCPEQSNGGLSEVGRYSDVTSMVADMKKNPEKNYQVLMVKDYQLSDEEHWDFSGLDVTLNFANEVKLSVVQGATAFITVDRILGTYDTVDDVILLNKSARLNIQGDLNNQKETKLEIQQLNIKTAEGNDGSAALVLGNQEDNQVQQVFFKACDFSATNDLNLELYNVTLMSDDFRGKNDMNLKLHGSVNWNTMLRADVSGNQLAGNPVNSTPETCAASFSSLTVENSYPNGAFIGNGLTVGTLDLSGNLNCDTLTAQTTLLTAGSFLCTTDVMTLNDITLRRNDEEKVVTLATQDIYKVGKKVHSGSIFLMGTLNRAEGASEVGFSFDKNGLNVVSVKNPPKYNIVSPYTAGDKINSGDVLATIGANASEAFRSHQNYSVNRTGMITSVHNENGTYQVTALDITTGIFVYEKISGKSASFADLTSVKDYISGNFGNDRNAQVEITINANYNMTDIGALDYSEVQAKVKLNLNGYEVKLLNNQNVVLDEIHGYSSIDVKGKLTLNKTNGILPKGKELVFNGVQLKPNTTTLTVGKEESSVILLDAGSTSLTKLTLCGDVQWSGTISVPNLDLIGGNLKATNITVSTKLTTQTGNTITVEPAGKLSLKNIEVQTGTAESFYIALEREVVLGNRDKGKESDPDFVDALQVENRGIGTVTISGTITNSGKAMYPITFKKMNCWTYEAEIEGTNQTIWQSKADNFVMADANAKAEKLATVNSATANNFMILSFLKDENGFVKEVIDEVETYSLDPNACTRKEGAVLYPASRILTVSLMDSELENHYASLEDAVLNIPKEFLDDKNKAINGTYVFTFLDDIQMKKAQTLPSCVKEAIFTTVGDEENGYQEQTLDIQTFKLTASGSMVLLGGLKIEGTAGTKTTPKLSIGKDLTITVNKLAGKEASHEYIPVVNVAVEVTKGTLYLNAKAALVLGNLQSSVTAKNVKAEGTGTLSMNSLTVKSGEASFRNTKTYIPSVTMEKSKLYLGEGAKAELGTIVVKSAYGMESMADYTIEAAATATENKAVHLYVEELTLPAGTFMAGANAVVDIGTVIKIKDMILGQKAKVTVNQLTQLSGAKNYLEKDSVLFINEKGNLETIIIGGKEGKEGDIYLGVGYKTITTTQGNETIEETKPGTLILNKVPTRSAEALMLKFFVGEENSVPKDKEGIIALRENQTVFSVAKAVKNFPLDLVEVIQPGNEGKEWNIYQSGTDIKVVGKYITISALQPNAGNYTVLGSFTSWADTMNYLTAHGNKATTYKVEINKDSVAVGGKMVLPKTVGSLIIEGVVTETVEGQPGEIRVPTYLDFTGDVSLTTNTEFVNVSFTKNTDVATGVHGMATAGKELVLDGVSGTFKSLTGNKTTKVLIKNSTINVPNKIQSIGFMGFENSTLYVKGNKAFTVTEVTMENSALWLDGKTTITNLVTEGMGNRIATRDLVISGIVSSSDNDEMKAGAVIGNVGGKEVVKHYIVDTDVEGDFSVKRNAIFLTKLDALGGKINPTTGDLVVTAAKVPASWFVITQNKYFSNVEERQIFEELYTGAITVPYEEGTREIEGFIALDLTNKIGNKIYAGAKPAKKVVLAKETEEADIQLDSFDTLQEALNEIAAIGDVKGKYIITLYGDDGSLKVDYKFTEKKAESIKICAAGNIEDENGKLDLIYKKDLDLKTNVTFENVILNPAADGNLKLNKYAVILKNTFFDEERKITVTDSNAAAKLILDNTKEESEQNQQQGNMPEGNEQQLANAYAEMKFAAIKQNGSLELKNTDVNVAGELKTGILDTTDSDVTVAGKATLTKWVVNSEDSVFRGEGTITIKDIYLKENATIETLILPTWAKAGADAGKITALKTQLTISGKLETESDEEELEFRVLCKKQDNSGFMDEVSVTAGEGNDQVTTSNILNAMANVMTDTAKGNGIVLAKAPNISTSDVSVEKNAYNNNIIKKNGELFCKNTKSYVTLEYEAGKASDGESLVVVSSFETFTDVVKEIDTLKVKRDYKVTFDGSGITALPKEGNVQPEGTLVLKEAIMSLTMPKAANVKTLTLEGTVYYTGAITFTSDVVLNNMKFVQVANTETDKNKPAMYRPVDETTIPAPVKVNNGGYKLSVVNGTFAKFNTPIELTGNKKGTLDLTAGKMFAGANLVNYGYDRELLGFNEDEPEGSLIQGSVKAFNTVRVGNTNVQIIGYPAYDAKTSAVEYKSTALETTTLNIEGTGEILVGYNSGDKDSVLERKDNTTVKDLNITSGKLKVMGDGSFTNVALSGKGPKLEVLGQKFNITGNLTNTANTVVEQQKEINAEITATYDKNYASVLDVKGDVILENTATNRIDIRITDPAGDNIQLGNTVGDIQYGTRLLTAAKAKVKDFKPSQQSLPQNLYEYGENNRNGYLVKKVGNYIEVVLQGSDEAACALFLEDGTLINYYPTANDAAKEIDSRKDKSQIYRIELYEDHGKLELGEDENGDPTRTITYQELKMPKEAKKVIFVGSTDEGKDVIEKIYFTKDISLGCDTEFKNLEFESAVGKDGKLTSSIKAGKFELTLEKCKANIKDISSTGIVNLKAVTEIQDEVTVKTGTEITVEGKATLQNIQLYGDADIHNKIIYKAENANNITVKGDIIKNGQAEPLYLNIRGTVVRPTDANSKPTSKVVNMEKATFDSFVVYNTPLSNGQNQVQSDIPLSVAWDSKTLYCVIDGHVDNETNQSNIVKVVETEVIEQVLVQKQVMCLDFNEAAEYIKNVGNLNKDFTITMLGNVSDANVTDTKIYSKLTLPAKDKAAFVLVDGDEKTLRFTDNIVTNGVITIKDITLNNPDKDFDITNNKNSKGTSQGEVTLENVRMGNDKTSISNIKGTAKVTKLNVVNSDLVVKGSITNLEELKLKQATIKSHNENAKSNILKFTVEEKGIWETFGVTTIGDVILRNLATGTEGKDVEQGQERSEITTYLGASRAKEGSKPNLTVTGKVNTVVNNGTTDQDVQGAVVVKLYDIENRKYLTEEGSKFGTYQGVKLLTAKTEAAEKFAAWQFAEANNAQDGYTFKEGVQAYKDAANDVMNGDITQMDVELSNSAGLKTYVATYAEAISIINSIGDKTANYTITLRGIDDNPDTDDKEGNAEKIYESGIHKKTRYVIKTDGKNGNSSYGKLLLPNANKVASLTIRGQVPDIMDEIERKVEICYTGNIAPKCNVTFENVHLSEGTVKNITINGEKVQQYTNSGLVTLNIGTVMVTLGENVTGGWEEQSDRNSTIQTYADKEVKIIFKSISGSKGTLALSNGQKIAVQGAITIPTLKLQGDKNSVYGLYTCGKVTLTDIRGGGKLDLATYHGTDVWKKGKTQLNIKGEAESLVSLNITPYIMTDKKTKTYEPINNVNGEDLTEQMLIGGSTKPIAYQQIAIAPKLASKDSSSDSKITLAGSSTTGFDKKIWAVKHEGGLYFTKDDYVVRVFGTGTNFDYQGEFLSWEQAVKEIEKIGRKDATYEILVLRDLGEDKPLAKVPMPSKAAALTIEGVNGIRGILTTANSVTINCTTTLSNVCINGAQLKGGKYYSKEFTMNVGNYALVANPLVQEHNYGNMGLYPCKFKLKGNSKSIADITVNQGEISAITAITGLGEVYLTAYYGGAVYVPGGITGVGYLKVTGSLNCGNKDLSVKELKLSSRPVVLARNVKVTGLAEMWNATIKVGTTTPGDGKIVFGDLKMAGNENLLEGKVDKLGRSLVEINGTVTNYQPNYELGITIALHLSDSTSKYVQLSEGLKLLKGTKVAASIIKPYYDGQNLGMGPKLSQYDLYKKGNDIIYGKADTGERYIPEARVWIRTTEPEIQNQKLAYVDYMTFEEALKGIDSMKNTEIIDGKKVFREYIIQLLNDVEVGNEKQNGSYKSISMPSKARELTILGDGHEITFTGNITLKCNTQLANVVLNPVKKVKNEVVPSKANVSVGNYTLTVNQAYLGEPVYNIVNEERVLVSVNNGVGNTTGSSKSGKLVLMPGNTWEANNITGLYGIEFVKNDNDVRSSTINVTGNLSVKDIIYSSNGKVKVGGNITTNTIHVNGDYDAEIYHDADKTMKINGTTITNPDKTKTTDAVFFEGAGENTDVEVYLESATGKDIPEGTQIISGKYLEAADWKFDINGITKNVFLRNNNLYVGSAVVN